MRKLSFILSFIIAISFAAEDLYAKPMRRGEGMHRGHGRARHGDICFGNKTYMKDTLKLTDKQIEDIGKINNKYMIKLLKIREELEPYKLKMRRLLLSNNVDLKEVRLILEKIADLGVEIRFTRIKQRLEIEKILTPEQRERLRREKRSRRKKYDRD